MEPSPVSEPCLRPPVPILTLFFQKLAEKSAFQPKNDKKDLKRVFFVCPNIYQSCPESYFLAGHPMVVYIQIKGNNLIDQNNKSNKNNKKQSKQKLPFKIIRRIIRKNRKEKKRMMSRNERGRRFTYYEDQNRKRHQRIQRST